MYKTENIYKSPKMDKAEYRSYISEKTKLIKKAVKAGDQVVKLIKIPVIKNDVLREEVKSQYMFFMWALDQKQYYKLLEKEKRIQKKERKMSVIDDVKHVTLTLRKNRSPLGGTMQFHLSELTQIGKNAGNRDTTDDEAVQYLKKSVQKLKENQYADKNEISILEKFLPTMASDEQIISFLDTLDISNMNKGQVMGSVKKNFGMLVDMKRVGEILKERYDS